MVEGTGLENQQAGNRLGGSNPSPSAKKKMKKEIEEIVKELCSPNGEFPTKIVLELTPLILVHVRSYFTGFKLSGLPRDIIFYIEI